MQLSGFKETPKFQSPEEEIAYLREQVAAREREILAKKERPDREALIGEKITEYRTQEPEKVLHKNFKMAEPEIAKLALDLSPEAHDDTMGELATLLRQKGVLNTISIVEKMNDPHIEDDFERFLVALIKKGFPIEGLKEGGPLFKGLRMTLYEISLPERGGEEQEKTLKELVSSMEQFYAGMLSVDDQKSREAHYFTLELAVENHSDEFIFYAAIPDSKKELFEKQVLSIFHNAKISERKNDYNIFSEGGASVASYAVSKNNPIFPLKTYEEFDHDPLNVILNSFSKVDKDGEGAAIQIIFSPAGQGYHDRYKGALDKILKGGKVKEAIDIPDSFGSHALFIAKDIAKSFVTSKEKEDQKKAQNPPKVDEIAAEQIKNKIGSTIVETNIRIVASSKTDAGAIEILSHIESAFNQFGNTNGNSFKFERVRKGALTGLIHDYSFRIFTKDKKIPLNLHELTTIMHLPSTVIKSAPQLKTARAGTAPAPIGLPSNGTLLGVNRNRGVDTKVYMTPEDRLRHFYTIGQTGTGKTTLLKNMIAQDIADGSGVCMIDPHGSDIQDILAVIPPERYEDVIYFDPSYTSRPMALNMLEFDRRFPEQKTFVVNELLSIFNKLFDMKTAGGPMFEQYFRNSVLLTMEDPDSGNTLLDVSRVLAQKSFREMKLSRCKNPIVIQFWKEVAEKAGGEASLANIVPYITSKFDNFLANDIMRPIIAQEKSAFNFREVMDGRKILLVNLAKGRLGDINANLIGLILVGKILMAALSRVDSFGQSDLPPFYLYIDEFQNITTDSIATILSEARKYRLSLNIAHQFIAQLEEKISDAVFGNVGSVAAFRVGSEDAEFLEKQFAPVFTAKDLINIENRNAYVKMLVNGSPVKPFNIETLPPPEGNRVVVDQLKELSYLKFGRQREEVEGEIMKKYQK